MKIIEYNDRYAEQVADMWNRSNENWGNDDSIKTGNDVINRESNSGNLKLFIAIDNEEVVGYCSFSEYQHDEGASYLPLLNVRPDYHGKKVGKQLILRVLEEAIQSKWPRFDLFTWSGNVKAMPLYKKCGFFWERNNQMVHLMNFLPTVYKTEALVEYLDVLDWYQDSKRLIDMEQDGVTSNGFDYYEYHFQNDQTELKLQFEKSGRGLRLIETPDYVIEMTLPAHELVYNQTYEVSFHIVNKSKKNLNVTLQGKDNKNIQTSFSKTISVSDEIIINEPFYVSQTTKIQDKMKTYPVVETELTINGKKAVFKLGLEPKCPVFLKLNIHQKYHILDMQYEGYLDIENNLSESTTFDITLPDTYITVLDHLKVTLQPQEKRSIRFLYTIKDWGFIKGDAVIRYQDEVITTEVMAIVKGHRNTFHAVIHETAFLINGNHVLIYDISHGRFFGDTILTGRPPFGFLAPQIGLPFTVEFTNIEPHITFPTEDSMDVKYKSGTFKDVELIIHISNRQGIITTYYELINKGSKRELALSIPIWANLNHSYLPYNDHILETNKTEGLGLGSIEDQLFDENWIYNKIEKSGICWDKAENVHIAGWQLSAIKEGIVLDTNESYSSHQFYLSYAHKDLTEFRTFAGNLKEKDTSSVFDISVNNGNPFTTDTASVSLINHKKKEVVGTMSCDGHTVDAMGTLHVSPGFQTIQFDLKDRFIEQKRVIYKVEGIVRTTEENGNLTVDNGVLSFKADRAYSDSIYSLIFDGKEWLDSNHPTPQPRAWWGTFFGGMTTRYDNIPDHLVLSEHWDFEFVKINDSLNNEWTGIKSTLTIDNDKDLKGLILETYTVTQPGVPLIHNFTKVINHTGKYFERRYFLRFNTIQADDDKTKVSFELDGITYKCGDIGIEKLFDHFAQLHSSRAYSIAFYNPKNEVIIGTQTDYTIFFSENRLDIPDQSSNIFAGDFILFTKDKLTKQYLQDLRNIQFEV